MPYQPPDAAPTTTGSGASETTSATPSMQSPACSDSEASLEFKPVGTPPVGSSVTTQVGIGFRKVESLQSRCRWGGVRKNRELGRVGGAEQRWGVDGEPRGCHPTGQQSLWQHPRNAAPPGIHAALRAPACRRDHGTVPRGTLRDNKRRALVPPVLRNNALHVADPALRGHPLLGVEAVSVEGLLGFVNRHVARKRGDQRLERLPIEQGAWCAGHQERGCGHAGRETAAGSYWQPGRCRSPRAPSAPR